jgi:hypothetical protein
LPLPALPSGADPTSGPQPIDEATTATSAAASWLDPRTRLADPIAFRMAATLR